MASRTSLNLSLWGEDAFGDVAGYAHLNWSYSRRESLDQCPRRYFYQYYAGCIASPAARDEVKYLREIKNRHLRIGELLHLAIGTYFKKKKLGTDLPPSWLQSWVRKLFAADQQYSRSIRAGGAVSTEQYPPTLLDEILLGGGGEKVLQPATEQLAGSIQRFFADDAFKPFRVLGSKPDSRIEHKLSLSGYPVPVSGKVDLAVYDGGSAIIVDWKLGCASDGGAESLQLATYGLWAQSTYRLPAAQIRIVKAHLADGAVVDFKSDDESLDNARLRIHQDLERMSILHRYGEAGTVEAFTPSPHGRVCRLCPFRQICPEGKNYG
jgi:PD-(D/E)XK nuclease superfamily